MPDRRFLLTVNAARRTYNLIAIEADFPPATVSGRLELWSFSHLIWKKDFEEPRQEVLHEK
jgi:hypothetical protein